MDTATATGIDTFSPGHKLLKLPRMR